MVYMVLTILPALAWATAQEACPEGATASALLQKVQQNVTRIEAAQEDGSGGCGMGVTGVCVATMDWKHELASMAPGASGNFFNAFLKVWDDVHPLTGTIFCMGDRPGSWIVSNTYGQNGALYDSYQGLTYLRNLFISPDDSQTWGTVGLYMGLFCPMASAVDQYTELKVGMAFNKCDSGVNFMLSISADTMECFADKFVSGLSRLAGMVPELSIGVSVDRKLSRTLTLAHGTGDSIRIDDITLTCHLAMSTTVRFSIGQLIGIDDTIGDLLNGDLQVQYGVAYDGTEDLVSALTWLTTCDLNDDLPDLFSGFASAYRVGPAAAASLLRETGAEPQVIELVEGIQKATSMLSVTGYLTLELSVPSNGILPDMSFQVAQLSMMLRTGPGSGQDTSDAESHLPGLYFYLSADLGGFVQSVVSTLLGQLGGLLDVVGVNVDGGVSLTADQGIGFFVNTGGIGFYTVARVSGSNSEIRCVFQFSSKKLKCKASLGWAELYLQSGKYILKKISNFDGAGAQDIAEFYASDAGEAGQKFRKAIVARGKEISNRVKCKLSNLLGGSCGRSGGSPSSCGDGTEYVIMNEQDRCLKVSPDCFEPDSDGKIYFFSRNCQPTFDECTHTSSSYATQMQNFWWFTTDRHLCNEYMHNMHFADIPDPRENRKCLELNNQKVWFSGAPTAFDITKKSTEKFRVAFKDVTGPYGQVCFQSSSGGSFMNQGRRRRRYWQEVYIRGYDGGRRRRRCDKDGAKNMRIYQKKEPGNGANYEKENGDAQFSRNCR